jgi:hypothetical protein
MDGVSPQQMTDNLAFSTRQFAPAERFARYRDFYDNGADAVELDAPVSADITAWRLGGIVLYERRLAGIGSERREARVRRNQFDHFTLQLNLTGEFHGEGAHGFQAVRPGEILLLDMAKPMRIRMPHAHLITAAVPRAALESTGAAISDHPGRPRRRLGPPPQVLGRTRGLRAGRRRPARR